MEQKEKLGSQDGVFITMEKMEEETVKEPPVPSLELIVDNFKVKELDPILE